MIDADKYSRLAKLQPPSLGRRGIWNGSNCSIAAWRSWFSVRLCLQRSSALCRLRACHHFSMHSTRSMRFWMRTASSDNPKSGLSSAAANKFRFAPRIPVGLRCRYLPSLQLKKNPWMRNAQSQGIASSLDAC